MSDRPGLPLLAGAFAVALALSFARGAPGDLPPEECVRLLREARLASQRGDNARRIEILRKAAAEYPSEILPVLGLSEVAREGGLSPEEGAALKLALRERIANPDSLLPESVLRELVADPGTSLDELTPLRAALAARLARAPSDPALLEAHAALSERLSDPAAARESAARLDAVQPSPTTLAWRIRLAAKAEAWPETAELCREFRRRYEDSPELRLEAARALASAGKRQEAREEIASLLADPKRRSLVVREFLLPLGWELYDAGRDADAKAVFQEAADAAPADGVPRAILRALFATPEERAALAAEREARLGEVRDINTLFTEATTLLTTGDVNGACAVFRRVVAADPKFEMAWFNLGVAAWRLARWEEAKGAFEQSASLNPARAEAILYIAECLRKLERCPEALPVYQQALTVRPELREAHAGLAACYRVMGLPEAAAKEEAAAARP